MSIFSLAPLLYRLQMAPSYSTKASIRSRSSFRGLIRFSGCCENTLDWVVLSSERYTKSWEQIPAEKRLDSNESETRGCTTYTYCYTCVCVGKIHNPRDVLIFKSCSLFWDITPCCPLKVNRRSKGTCLRFQGWSSRKQSLFASWFMMVSCLAYSSTLKIEALCSSVTSVYIQQTTRHYVAEDISS
jgi:hypothetical protein